MQVANRFTTWSRLHPKVFPVVGALLGILTFTIKEAWRDRVKDDLAKIDSAMAALSVRDHVTSAWEATLESASSEGLSDSNKPSINAFLSCFHESRILRLKHRIVADLKELSAQLGSANNKELDEDEIVIYKAEKAVNECISATGKFDNKQDTDYDNVKGVMTALMLANIDIGTRILGSSHRLTQKAEGLKKGKDFTLSVLTIVAVTMYLIAGFLGIAGKLSEVDDNTSRNTDLAIEGP